MGIGPIRAGIGPIRATATASDAELIALGPFGRRECQLSDPDALQALAYSELRAAWPR